MIYSLAYYETLWNIRFIGLKSYKYIHDHISLHAHRGIVCAKDVYRTVALKLSALQGGVDLCFHSVLCYSNYGSFL